MPNTDKMMWPYPNKDSDPWFDEFESMVSAMNSSGYAAREDRNIIFGGGGDVSWNAGTGVLSWAEDMVAYSMIAGRSLSVPAGSTVVADGDVLYVDVTRSPTHNATIAAISSASVPNTDSAMAIAVRVGSTIFWRWGSKIETGETLNVFGVPGSSDQADTYERDATFDVPPGAYADEATVGRIVIAGSLVGISAELTRPATAGTVTVNVKSNGVTRMSVQLNAVDSTFKQMVAVPGVHIVGIGDSITVEVASAGYSNSGGLSGGLTINLVFSTGLMSPPATVGVGAAGESLVSIFKCGEMDTHDSLTPKVVSQFSLNPLSYNLSGTTRGIAFRAVASNGGGVASTNVRLYNLTDADIVTTLNFTSSMPTMKEVTLIEGLGAGQISPSGKVYEVRIWVDAPDGVDDSIEFGSAEVRVFNTIN